MKLLFHPQLNVKLAGKVLIPNPVSAMVRVSPSAAGGRGFYPRPGRTKDLKMVPVATLLGAKQYKASTGKYLSCW